MKIKTILKSKNQIFIIISYLNNKNLMGHVAVYLRLKSLGKWDT